MNMRAKMKKAIFVTHVKYPRSGAPSNYIQYLAEALKALGYQVFVVGSRNNDYLKEQGLAKSFHSVNICQVVPEKPVILQKIVRRLFFKKLLALNISALKPGKYDLVIEYSINEQIHEVILKLRNKNHFSAVSCPTEWFGPENFESGYDAYRRIVEQYRPQYDLIFPISKKIQSYYEEKGCRTCLLPIMADCTEYENKPKVQGIYKVILIAHGAMKDSLDTMIMSIANVIETKGQIFEFHATGIKQQQVIEILGETRYSALKSSIILHGWMEYDELIQLYQDVHFLLLARDISQMTLSNFPSKIPECLAYGIVPLMSNVGDCPKYYLEDKKNSFIIDGCSVEACSKTISEAVSLPWEDYVKMSNSARECAVNRFDFRNWLETIRSAVQEI